MIATLIRTKTFWIVAVVLLGYGIITWDDDDGGTRAKPDTDDKVNVTLEVYMSDTQVKSIDVGIAATLGSAGNFAERRGKVPNFFISKTGYVHRFQARRGDRLNAEVANLGQPVDLYQCAFYQQGFSRVAKGDEFERHYDQDGALPGYGDITDPGDKAGHGNALARCTATVK